jgi:hypothetical protein
MSGNDERDQAAQPNDLGRLFLEWANAGDVDGLVALYEPDAGLPARPSHHRQPGDPSGVPATACRQAHVHGGGAAACAPLQ